MRNANNDAAAEWEREGCPYAIDALLWACPGLSTEEIVDSAIAAQAHDEDGPELPPEVSRVLFEGLVQIGANAARLVERDGGWYLVNEIVREVGAAANARGEELTPQELQKRSGLSERATVKAMDSLEFWAPLDNDCPVFDWDGWDVDDADAKMKELIGEDWKAKWEEV